MDEEIVIVLVPTWDFGHLMIVIVLLGSNNIGYGFSFNHFYNRTHPPPQVNHPLAMILHYVNFLNFRGGLHPVQFSGFYRPHRKIHSHIEAKKEESLFVDFVIVALASDYVRSSQMLAPKPKAKDPVAHHRFASR